MQTIGVIGGGVLGRAIARGFIEHAEVRVFDVVRERSTHSQLSDVATCDIVMIALPTPANPDGTCNTLAIDDFLRTAKHEDWWTPQSCYVIRSTVPIGYTQAQAAQREFKLPLLHSPEFLTARCSLTDFQIPARNIIGVPQFLKAACPGCARMQLPVRFCPACGVKMQFDDAQVEREVVRQKAVAALSTAYRTRFPGVPVHVMPSNASELVKLACNTFFASKVTLFNLFAQIAKAAGVEWEDVRGGILSDGRIAHAHTLVAEQPQGFGGSCLPKDASDLFHCATALGVDAEIIRAVLDRNERQRRPYDPDLAKIALPPR